MMHQNRTKIKLNPEAAAKKRVEIIAILKKVNMRIIPFDFEIEVFGDTEYPKMVKVRSGENILDRRVYSREEEDSLENKWTDPDAEPKKKPGRPKKEVKNGDSEDGSAGDQPSI